MSVSGKIAIYNGDTAPDNAPAGYIYFYCKSGLWFQKDENGVITSLTGRGVSSTRASPQLVASSGTLTVPTSYEQTIRVAGNGGAVTGVLLPAGTYDGQRVTLQGCHDTNTVELATSGAMAGVSSGIVLSNRTFVTFEWDSGQAEWVDIGGNYR